MQIISMATEAFTQTLKESEAAVISKPTSKQLKPDLHFNEQVNSEKRSILITDQVTQGGNVCFGGFGQFDWTRRFNYDCVNN